MRKHILGLSVVVLYVVLMLKRVELKKNAPDYIVFFLNTMPNFLSGLFFTFTFYNLIQKKWNKSFSLLMAIFITGSWLTIEEYFPIFSHNKYFDYFDIIMSWIGSLIAFFTIKYHEKFKIKFFKNE